MDLLGKIDLSRGFNEAWSRVTNFVPRFIAFLAILLIGYFIAKVIAKVLDRVLDRVGLDRLMERGGLKRAFAGSRYEPSDLVSKLVFYALMLFVLQLAFQIWGPNPISDVINGIIAFLPRIFVAIAILIIGAAIASALRQILGSLLGGLSYGRALATLAYGAVLVIAIFAALDQLKIAPAIVNGLFYAILAIIVGSAIVAIGGSGIGPMRQVWERGISRVQEEAPRIRHHAKSSGGQQRRTQYMEELTEQVRREDESPGVQ